MPYAIRKRGSQYVVINKETGDVKGTHDSLIKAQKQRRLLEGIHRGTLVPKKRGGSPGAMFKVIKKRAGR